MCDSISSAALQIFDKKEEKYGERRNSGYYAKARFRIKTHFPLIA